MEGSSSNATTSTLTRPVPAPSAASLAALWRTNAHKDTNALCPTVAQVVAYRFKTEAEMKAEAAAKAKAEAKEQVIIRQRLYRQQSCVLGGQTPAPVRACLLR